MGRIGAGLDRPEGREINTHVKAIMAEPRLILTHVADRDADLARKEAARFGVHAQVVAPEAIVTADIDALCIATPTGTHLEYLERAGNGKARVILVEKPLEGDSWRRSAAMDALAVRGATVAVNHFRRWIPGLSDWIADARSGGFGRALHAIVAYDRGLHNNGAHAFDLIAAFIGAKVMNVVELAPPIADLSIDDGTHTLCVMLATETGEVPLIMLGCDGRVQSVFSVDMRFERARVMVFNQRGVRAELYQLGEAGVPGFAQELTPTMQYHDEPPHLLARVWRNVADHLDTGISLACAGTETLAAYDLADAIISRCRK